MLKNYDLVTPQSLTNFINGMRWRWYNYTIENNAHGKDNIDFINGWTALDKRLTNPPAPAEGIEGKLWEQVAEQAWTYVITTSWSSNAEMALKIAQLADIMVEKLRGKQENDISFFEKLNEMSKLGINIGDFHL